ncbi:hypothetical protein [Caballeronia grimmiae]|uniref:Uncharacterized protein n=1 Tax=Caballeronia grimmiae TaxID=1071679 RepID=A0A069P2Z7_9BURK|nr:hypothetical protein [Caballeronia grimmiae]KDR34827.1 hypothetical protein BG57_04050 [Caballeronia grimmiae]GGD63064.1 hypothetical protein GCM10010985_16460 [Caballeronia grimmiae]
MQYDLVLKILREISAPGSGNLFSRREAARSAADLIERQSARITELEAMLPADPADMRSLIAASASAEPVDCAVCGGTGDVSGEYPGVACQACGGTGKSAPAIEAPAQAVALSEREAEWRALFNSTRSDATFEQFCGWMREELAALSAPASMSAENRPAQDDVRDAQRYRFLKAGAVLNEWNGGWNTYWLIKSVDLPDGRRDIPLDEAIDAAIASQSAKEPR